MTCPGRRRHAGAAGKATWRPCTPPTQRHGVPRRIDIPIIDWRNYLEESAQHAQLAPVVRRAPADAEPRRRRVQPGHLVHRRAAGGTLRPDADGAAGDGRVDAEHRRAPGLGAGGTSRPRPSTPASPPTARCSPRGDEVWDGILDDARPEPARRRFPIYATSRIVAGGPIEGGVSSAPAAGGQRRLPRRLRIVASHCRRAQLRLEQIFPTGVCDYTKPDQGLPPEMR